VKNYGGELRAGSERPGPIHARIWIDQEMKKKMGFLIRDRAPAVGAWLSTRFRSERGTVTAVDDVSFDVAPGETGGHRRRVGLGQECHRAVDPAALIPDPPGQIANGQNPVRGPRTCCAWATRNMPRDPRRPHRDDLSRSR